MECRETFTAKTCEQLLGYREARRKDWITDRHLEGHRGKESPIKQRCRRLTVEIRVPSEAEEAAKQHNPKELYKITRQLAGRNKGTRRSVKYKQGNLLTKESQQMALEQASPRCST